MSVNIDYNHNAHEMTKRMMYSSFARAKGLVNEFMELLNKYGLISLAIAVIIGGAANKLVSALEDDICARTLLTRFI